MGKKAAAGAKKKVPSAPLGGGAPKQAKKSSLFEKKARNFRIGGDIQPKRDLTRFVKWPMYIRLQRQKRILLQRIKMPPSLAQFQATCDKQQFLSLARLCKKLAPETRAQKKERLGGVAASKVAGKGTTNEKPCVLKFGINHVSDLVENKKAKLVIIAHDVDPIEIVAWMPALCRKKDIPYCIVKGKARLGQLVGKKTASCIAIQNVRSEDHKDLAQLCENMKAQFNDNEGVRRRWGGGIMGVKSQHVTRYRQMLVEKEMAKKTGLL